MHTPTQKLDKGLEGALTQANYLRWKKDPIAQTKQFLKDAGESLSDYSKIEIKHLAEEMFPDYEL